MIEITLLLAIELVVCFFFFEVADSCLGAGFGTLGTPTLILIGFDAKIVVPTILIAQAIGGISATYWHHRWGNADFSNLKTIDMKKVIFVVAAGIAGVVIGSIIGFKISKDILMYYIGAMITAMGIIVLSNHVIKFTWPRMAVLSLYSAGNKGVGSSGYGPIMTGGQAILGQESKNSIAVTDCAEIGICIAGAITWIILAGKLTPWDLTFLTSLGAFFAPILGCWLTYKLHNTKRLKQAMGVVILILGILCLTKMLSP